MKLVAYIKITDEEFARDLDPKQFAQALQDAVDAYWSTERMGTVYIRYVKEQEPPTEGEIIGPLG